MVEINFQPIKDEYEKMILPIQTKYMQVINNLNSLIGKLEEYVSLAEKAVRDGMQWLADKYHEKIDPLVEKINNITNGLKTWFEEQMQIVKDWMESLTQTVTDFVADQMQALVDSFNDMMETMVKKKAEAEIEIQKEEAV